MKDKMKSEMVEFLEMDGLQPQDNFNFSYVLTRHWCS